MGISKCTGEGCNKRDTCYHFSSIPNEHYQSYFTSPVLEKNGECEMYWDNYNRMNPSLDELIKRLEEYVKVSYGTNAYELSQKEAELIVKVLKENT